MKIISKKLLALIALPLLAVSTIASAQVCETWSVIANPQGTERGQWNFQNGSDPGVMYGAGNMRLADNSNVSFNLQVTTNQDGSLTALRTQSSDGNNCVYTGVKVGSSLSGTYLCSEKTPFPQPWSGVAAVCTPKASAA